MAIQYKDIHMTISFNNGSVGSCNNSGILKLQINSAGHLICTYVDNTIEDLGLVVGRDGTNGTNFYPDEVGFEIPDSQFRAEKDIGWSYLSLANNTSILYFKTSAPDVVPATWNSVEFGKGDKGDAGRPFTIDSQGTTLPTTGLFDEYTFLNTSTGMIQIYDLDTTTWRGPFPWVGKQGIQGVFKIDLEADELPPIDDLPLNYMVYDTDDGFLYYVEENPDNPGQKQWSKGILFRGKQGEKGDSIKGDPGEPGASVYAVHNVIDTSYTNALLVIGTVPIGYVITNIQVNVEQAYTFPVTDMLVRFGGTAQSEIDGTVIAPFDYFDINTARKYIVDEINHEPSDKEEIISCIFNESVNNSPVGKMSIYVQMAKQLPDQPISDNI